MNDQYFEQWSKVARHIQKPFQAWAALNVKTLQGLSYIKPEHLAQIKKPEEILEKQVNLSIENGHKLLDYCQQSFEILEDTLLSLTNTVRESTRSAVGSTQSTMDTARSLFEQQHEAMRSAVAKTKPSIKAKPKDKDAAKSTTTLKAGSAKKSVSKKTKLKTQAPRKAIGKGKN